MGQVFNLFTGKTLYVDGTFGAAVGSRQIANNPYLTIAAAKAAAQSGDRVEVRPGTYAERNVLSGSIHMNLQAGAVIEPTGSASSNRVIRDSTGPITGGVYGEGEIRAAVGNINWEMIRLDNAASDVTIRARRIVHAPTADTGTSAVVNQFAGNIDIVVDEIDDTAGAGLAERRGVWWQGGNMHVRANRIVGNTCIYSSPGVAPVGGELYVTADLISCELEQTNGLGAIESAGADLTGKTWIEAREIRNLTTGGTGTSKVGVSHTSGKLYLFADKITAVADAPFFQSGTSPGELWLQVQKIEVQSVGCFLGGGSQENHIDVMEVDNSDGASYLMRFAHSTGKSLCRVGRMTLHADTPIGFYLDTSTSLTIEADVDATASLSGTPVKVFSGSPILRNCSLRAASGQYCISADTPVTVQVEGTLTLNGPVSPNVTLVGGPVVYNDTGLDLMNLGMKEVSVTGTATATVGRMHVCSGTTSDYTVTLPTAVGNTGRRIGFRFAVGLTKRVTLDGNGSETVAGAASRVLWEGEVLLLVSDGANWQKESYSFRPMTCTMYLGADQVGAAATATVTKATIDTVPTGGNPTGAMADTTNKRINVLRDGIYLASGAITFCSATGGGNGIGANSPRILTQLWLNGTGFVNAECSGLSAGYPAPFAVKPKAATAGQYFELAGFQNSGGTLSYLGTSGQETSLSITEVRSW